MTLPRTDICAVIPCYNEAESIARVVRATRAYVTTVLVVDDCSTDATAAEAEAAGAVVLRQARNLGKGAALKAGFVAADQQGFVAAVTLDGDGQHDVTEIPLFVEAFDHDGTDLVIGNRMNDTRTMPLVRRLTNRFMSWVISRVSGRRIHDTQCGYRLIRLSCWRKLPLNARRFDFESELLIKACRRGAQVSEVRIRTIYFGTRQSKIRPVADSIRFILLLWHCRHERA
jgi:glycosyltransferase involved in cell wall biosynthesis